MPPEGWTKFVVCGAHMRGLLSNHQLAERGGRFVSRTRTAKACRLYPLPAIGDLPPRPGMVRDEKENAAIAFEVAAMPITRFGDLVEQIPAPLGIGKIEFEGGESASGFLCEPYALVDAENITDIADWRVFMGTGKE